MRRSCDLVSVLLGTAFLAACGGSNASSTSMFVTPQIASPQAGVASPSLTAPLMRHASSSESVLYDFDGSDGEAPEAPLLLDPATGALYGTTNEGGKLYQCYEDAPYGCGTVFKLTPSGSGYVESVLYKFSSGKSGRFPRAGLLMDGKGALYGTTTDGGTSLYGTVFKLTPSGSGYAESYIYNFRGRPDGEYPGSGALIADKSGALYGTTIEGGNGPCGGESGSYTDGCGTVFKLTPSGMGYVESVVYNFQGQSHKDGSRPWNGLISDATGALYGTTVSGGSGQCAGVPYDRNFGGCGTVFKLTPSGSTYNERVLYSFKGVNHPHHDGAAPVAGVILDGTGAIYGTTSAGGSGEIESRCDGGCGTVFKLTPKGKGYTETVLHSFLKNAKNPAQDGYAPQDTLLLDGSGELFGTTNQGGTYEIGTVFQIKTSGKGYSIDYSFDEYKTGEGWEPDAGLIVDGAGTLYGTASSGGIEAKPYYKSFGGTVFKLTQAGSRFVERTVKIR